MTSLIENVIKFVQQHSNFENIRMESTYDRNIPPMMLDEKKIKQVLINLFMNCDSRGRTQGMYTDFHRIERGFE